MILYIVTTIHYHPLFFFICFFCHELGFLMGSFATTSQILRSNFSHEEDNICVNNNCESQSKVGNVKGGGQLDNIYSVDDLMIAKDEC